MDMVWLAEYILVQLDTRKTKFLSNKSGKGQFPESYHLFWLLFKLLELLNCPKFPTYKQK